MLPADVTGSNVYNEHEREFEFAQGPVFSTVVLADEINRAPPKTESARSSQWRSGRSQSTGDASAPAPFVVIATQNPIEQEGTFQLPDGAAAAEALEAAFNEAYPDVGLDMNPIGGGGNQNLDAVVANRLPERATRRARAQTSASTPRFVAISSTWRGRHAKTTGQRSASRREASSGSSRQAEPCVIAGRRYSIPDDVKRLANATMSTDWS